LLYTILKNIFGRSLEKPARCCKENSTAFDNGIGVLKKPIKKEEATTVRKNGVAFKEGVYIKMQRTLKL